ncbi:MAG: DUF4389 domain-containing protein [Actinomycetota bacterium]
MYPVTYEADFAKERNRLTTLFRLIVAIPWLIVLYIYAIGGMIVWVIAWFALLILGRYPDWAYNFMSGFLRFQTRVNAWLGLQADEWPPFGFAPDPTYPIRVQVAPKAEKQSRLKVFFRGILAIPLLFVAFGVNYIHLGAALVSWLTIVFRGYQPAGVHNALLFTNAFNARLNAYLYLLTDAYPPVGDEGPQVGDLPAPGQPALGGAGAAAGVSQPQPPAENQ